MEQWNEAAFAQAWAAENMEDNEARKATLDLLVAMVADYFAATDIPRHLLDLGCGHGIIAARLLRELPDLSLVGVDGSTPMLDLAARTLAPYAGRFALRQADFETISADDLPDTPFGVAIAVQSIHNASDEGKQRAISAGRARLAPGGLFLLVDRVRLAAPALFPVYSTIWRVLGSTYNRQQSEGATFAEHARSVAARGDQPGSVEQNVLWLREAGFSQVAAVHVVGVRAIIAATAS